ncbi:MAG: carbohydrate-binding protein [Verrucomicrobiota bacterium JB023]|nr:carbohydrate-binding protein [Verrucomicrobiota bacterium JB023]
MIAPSTTPYRSSRIHCIALLSLILSGGYPVGALTVNVDIDADASENFSGQGGYGDAGNDYWNSSTDSLFNLTASDGITETTIDIDFSTTSLLTAIGGNVPAGQSHSNLVGDYTWARDTDLTLDITGLKPNEPYRLYIYCQGDRLSQKATVSAAGGSAVSTTGLLDGTISENENYVVLDATADLSGIITCTIARNGSRYAALNGLQIVELNPATPHTFTHPGIGYTSADLDAIKARLDEEPWKTGFEDLQSATSLDYTMQGPFATVGHTAAENRNAWRADMIAMHNLARLWYLTDNEAYAQKAYDILMSWVATHTEFIPGETYLDMGYHAHDVFQGADLLRGSWSGWTQADTDTLKTYFENVWWNSGRLDFPGPLRSANQGMAQFVSLLNVAVFNDDTEKLMQCLHAFRTDATCALPSSLPNGQIGDTGRDAHDQGQLLLMARAAETFWQQGIDVFSENEHRLLAAGEYLARHNLDVHTPFIQAGTVYDIYPQIHTFDQPYQTNHIETPTLNILYNAYVKRLGMSAPYLEKYQALAPQNLDSFTYLPPVDNSTASSPSPLPDAVGVASVTSLNSTNIGDATGGGASYSDGTWTISGRGSSLWYSSSPDYHFAYLPVKGNATLIAQVTSLSGGDTDDARAGLVFTEDFTDEAAMQAIVVSNPAGEEDTNSFRRGDVAHSHQGNSGSRSYPRQSFPKVPYWFKIERIGSRVNCYSSPDGISWSCGESADYDVKATAYFGLAVSSGSFNSTATATFANVRITGGDGGEAIQAPAAPFAIYASPGENEVPLHWLESFEADSYKIWRSSQPGGPYSLLTEQSGTSFVDTTINPGSYYYYKVSAVNTAGESPLSPEENLKFVKADFYQAEDYDAQSGVRTEETTDVYGGINLSFLGDGDWTRYDDIFIEEGSFLQARVAGYADEIGDIEVRIGSPTGTLIGTADVIDTGGTQWWGTVETPLTIATGTYDLYFVYTSVTPGTGTGFNLNWFDIVPATVTTRIEGEDFVANQGTRTETTQDIGGGINVSYISHGDWLHYGDFTFQPGMTASLRLARPDDQRPASVVEIRLDSPTGRVVGSMNLSATGGWQVFETFEIPLATPLSGTHPLYLTFRETGSTVDGASVVNLNWLELSASSIASYDLGMDLPLSFDPTAHELTNCNGITDWDATSTYLQLEDGSNLSALNLPNLGVSSWTTTDFGDPALVTDWRGSNLSGVTLHTDGNFGAGDLFAGADFSDLVWGTPTSTADPARFFSEGSGATSAATQGDAIDLSGADLSLITGTARTTLINNLGGFDGDIPIGAQIDTTFLTRSGWDAGTLLDAGWQLNYVDAYSIIQAEDFDSQSGILTQTTEDTGGGLNVQAINNGEWTAYEGVYFDDGNGAGEFQARVASNTSGGAIEIRLDSPTGPLVGTASFGNTGGWQNWQTVTAPVSGASGYQDVYLVFTGGGGFLFNLNWFTFAETSYTELENWRFTHFGSYENSGNAADDFDSDQDGIPNLIEYATGLDPHDPSAGSAIRITPSISNPGELEVTFNRIVDPSLTYTLQTSDTLLAADWSDIHTVKGNEGSPILTGEPQWQGTPADGKRFFRLKVSY